MNNKNLVKLNKILYNNNIKNKGIYANFIVKNTNKYLEHLIYRLNFQFFNFKSKKINYNGYVVNHFSVSVDVSNYLFLKDILNFEFKEEEFKFEFISINIGKNNLSVQFFEDNFLGELDREEVIDEASYISNFYLIINISLKLKIILFLYLNITKILNTIKYVILNSVNNTPSSK